jgi:hypothetical protein
VLECGGSEGRSTPPLHSRSVRCDELNFQSSNPEFWLDYKVATHPFKRSDPSSACIKASLARIKAQTKIRVVAAVNHYDRGGQKVLGEDMERNAELGISLQMSSMVKCGVSWMNVLWERI